MGYQEKGNPGIDRAFLQRGLRAAAPMRNQHGESRRPGVHSLARHGRHIDELSLVLMGWQCCAYCATELGFSTVTVDHVIPRSKLGPERLENLVPACSQCNLEKGEKSAREFLASKGLCEHRILDWFEFKDEANKLRALLMATRRLELSPSQRARLGVAPEPSEFMSTGEERLRPAESRDQPSSR